MLKQNKTKTNPSRYTSNFILLRGKLLVQQSVHRRRFDHQVQRLSPLENFLCSGQAATLMVTDIKTGSIQLKNSLWIKWFLV